MLMNNDVKKREREENVCVNADGMLFPFDMHNMMSSKGSPKKKNG